MQRQTTLATLARETFDLLIVGGGITGTGAARDAASRGLKVALVEKDDFASGTSSRSSKLIHGGLRYLEHAEFKLVFESVNERKRLMRLARHLVRPLPFLVTRYQGDRRWLATLDLGLWIYDALCLWGSYRNHKKLGASRVLDLESTLRRDGLDGGILYYDCLTDDARLTLENALDARALGATLANHVKAGKLITEHGRVTGLEATDSETGATFAIRSKVVLNASGPWSDEVMGLLGTKPMLRPTKGVHVVVDAKRLPVTHALMMSSPRDKRVVFLIPWGLHRTVIGTTDTDFHGSLDQLQPERSDIDYLLETANWYCPDAKLEPADVLATWSGVRPLLRPLEGGGSASDVSREHVIIERAGFITIAGGKLTTYRRMALEVVDRALEQLQLHAESGTHDRPLPGAVGLEDSDGALDALANSLTDAGTGARFFAETYGARAKSVLQRMHHDETAGALLDQELPYRMAQVDEAIDSEFACTLDDVLSRRVPLLLRGRDQGLSAAPLVAQRMAQRLGWSPERIERELTAYQAVVSASRAFR